VERFRSMRDAGAGSDAFRDRLHLKLAPSVT
jgi:hypothetical protein